MIRSMTGFGRATWSDGKDRLDAEVRSVNNRFLKVVTKFPEFLLLYEGEAQKIVQEQIHRGTVYITVEHQVLSGEPEYSFCVPTMRAYYQRLVEAQRQIGCEERITLDSLIGLPGVMQREKRSEEALAPLWDHTVALIREAIGHVLRMREEEGRSQWEQLDQHRQVIARALVEVEKRAPDIVSAYRDRLLQRVNRLLEHENIRLSEHDVHREVALLAERSDVTEEIGRLRSHLNQMDCSQNGGQPVGRKLEFIAQEMFREANTMASKAAGAELLPIIVRLKGEVDKIREQVLNIE